MQCVALAAKGLKGARTAGLQSLSRVARGCHLLAQENGHACTHAGARTQHTKRKETQRGMGLVTNASLLTSPWQLQITKARTSGQNSAQLQLRREGASHKGSGTCVSPKIGGVSPRRRCLFVTGDSSVLSGLAAACTVPRRRSIRWRRRGSSVAVFRLGVLRYNHMTVGRKQPQKKKKKQPLHDLLSVGGGGVNGSFPRRVTDRKAVNIKPKRDWGRR